MNEDKYRFVYGPVPSRRLGRSLGIDLVPYKTCTYDCVYCQLGRTTKKTVERGCYAPMEQILAELECRLSAGDDPDYISLAGSGEPTLNCDIGPLIEVIKRRTDIPVAVLTNGSLLWNRDVQDEIMAADLVLPSLDAGDEAGFAAVNRPHCEISFELMAHGLADFVQRFPSEIWLEVFLLSDGPETAAIAAAAERIGADRVQLNTVTRPPADSSAAPLSADEMDAAARLFGGTVEIIGTSAESYPDSPVRHTGEDSDIVSLIRRRPCTAVDVAQGLSMNMNEVVKRLDSLVSSRTLRISDVSGMKYYSPSLDGEISR
jgi:wyosine [tRNA(Phe)-imidazoG37] synthetase (radical SAM superfamily)